MTSLAEGGPEARSRGRLVWVALVLSIILNLLFIGGLFWIRAAEHTPPGPAERFSLAAGELDLSADQKKSLHALIGDVRQYGKALRENNKPLIDGIWSELSQTPPDQAKIDRLVDQAAENRRAFQRDMTAALGRFFAVLTPEQRNRFAELVKRPRDQSMGQLVKRLFAF
jgi:Spy/CpxP family protein refolding chaperone